MKKLTCLFALLILGILTSTGCKKGGGGGDQPQLAVLEINGVKVEFGRFQAAFDSAPQEISGLVGDVRSGIRYRQYNIATEALEKLAADTTLTEDQKKVVTDITEQIKQAAAKEPPPAAGQ
jgi:hypothetical protein